MEFDSFDKLSDIATGLNSLVTATDELYEDPPPSLNPATILELRRVLADASRVLAQLEEQREASGH
jgi:hypothetical protein